MQATLILFAICAAVLLTQAQYHDQYDHYRPPSCGRCDYRDFRGKPGAPGPQV